MNYMRVRIGEEDAREDVAAGPVHEEPALTYGRGKHIDTRISIRVATPRDGERLRRMLSRVSTETIYRRFYIPYPVVPEPTLALMLDADHHDKESLVAIAEEEIIGHAMYARPRDGTDAEMAIIVEDRWQSKGVGKLLLLELAERAKLRGIETFTAVVLGTNRRMIRSGHRVRRDPPQDTGWLVLRSYAATHARFDSVRCAKPSSHRIRG